jgi:predicted transcriptional regulator
MSNWTLFSNHGHVLICLSRDSHARLRDVAADVGITERAVQKIVRDLQQAGMIDVTKNGRRNSYQIHLKKPLRHDLEKRSTLKDLIKVVNKKREISGESPQGANKANKHSAVKAVPPVINVKPASFLPDKKKAVKPLHVEPVFSKPKSGKRRKEEKQKPPEKKQRQQGSLF